MFSTPSPRPSAPAGGSPVDVDLPQPARARHGRCQSARRTLLEWTHRLAAGFLLIIAGAGFAQTQQPTLRVTRTDTDALRLVWPAAATNFVLETTGTLSGSPAWTVVAQTPLDGDPGEVYVQIPAPTGDRFYRLRQAGEVLTTIAETSPRSGEDGVAVTRETIIRFSEPLAEDAVLEPGALSAEFGGRQLLGRSELSLDRKSATLFYLENLPASARIRVRFNAAGLKDQKGRDVDADGDGQPGGIAQIDFDTVSITPIANTSVMGRVYASELAEGELSSTNVVEQPLPGVTIEVIGAEESIRTTTDDMGNFILTNAPAGRFFVRIDGRTSPLSAWPDGDYYPVVEKAWEVVAGRENNLAGGTGTIYLPLIRAGTLQPVSMTEDTLVEFPDDVLQDNPELAGVSLMVPANSLFADNGNRGGRVGIAPVAPNRLPEPLPMGLEHVLDISVQTDGAQNFDRPIPVRFPNLPDPNTGLRLPPGTKTALWSYNHDLGRWEVQGSMTVTADGLFIESDPGEGVRQPGWHGVSSTTPAENRPPERDPCDQPTSNVVDNVVDLGAAAAKCAAGLAGVREGIAAALTIAVELRELIGNVQTAIDKAKAGENVAATAAVFKSVNNAKKSIAAGIEAFQKQNPVGKALAISRCVGDVLSALDNICGRTVSNTGNCSSTLVRVSCIGIGVAKTVMNQVNDLIDKADKGLKELGLALVCGLIDKLATLLDIGSRNSDADRIAATLAGLPPDDPVPPEVIAEMEDLLVAVRSMEMEFGAVEELAMEVDKMEEPVGFLEDVASNLHAELLGIPPNAPYLMQVGELTIRGRASAAGLISQILAPQTEVTLWVLDIDREMVGVSKFVTSQPGRPTLIPEPVFMPPSDFTDTDEEGLIDLFEDILGTSREKADSDEDGFSDYEEAKTGGDPLSGLAVATGVIASASTGGNAVDVAAVNAVAVTANEADGIAVLNVFRGLNPTVIARVDTPGTARRVALAGIYVAVADGAAGLAIVDISDPPAARILHQVNLASEATAVATDGTFAYVGTSSGNLFLIDLATGQEVVRVPVGEPVQDVVLGGDNLFVLTRDNLQVLEYLDGSLERIASIPSPHPFGINVRLFVGGGLAYATHQGGYNTFDVTVPGQPRLLGAGNTQQRGWKQIVDTGSGLGVAAVGANPNLTGAHNISVYDVSDPTVTQALLGEFVTPGIARALTLFNGFAFVADGPAGLQVVNYLAFDSLGQPPTIQLQTSTSEGFAEEGRILRITADARDDVQVRNVEFHVNDVRVLTDGNFPFEIRIPVPTGTVGSEMRIRARATDTGGNATWSDTLTLTIVPDATAPKVRRTVPSNGGLVGGITSASAFFSEPLDPATVDGDGIQFLGAGDDGVFGTGDDVTVEHTLLYREALNLVVAEFAERLTPGNYRMTLTTALSDPAGNHLAAPVVVGFRVFSFIDDDFDGMPDELEEALGLDPTKADTDGDGILDGLEDKDGDTLPNAGEIFAETDPNVRDTDGNGIPDGAEDPDGDALSNTDEFRRRTNPLVWDTDGDGWNDESEIAGRSDPLDPGSTPFFFIVGTPDVSAVSTGFDPEATLPLSTVVAAPAVSVSVTGIPTGPDTLPLSTIVGLPVVEVSAPGIPTGPDALPLGTVVGLPAVSVSVPGVGTGPGALPLGTVVGLPAVTASVPGIPTGPDALPLGTVVAQPAVSAAVTGVDPAGTTVFGTVVGQPLVRAGIATE